MKRSCFRYLLLLPLWLSAAGILQAQSTAVAGASDRIGIIFSVDGSGDDTRLTDSLRAICRERQLPLYVYRLRWCRWGQLTKDHTDYEAQMIGAARLRMWIASHRAARPQDRIVLVGHSAGAHVVLEALNGLPPNSVDRTVLLAASVSNRYDLQVALRNSRHGIDAWYSTEDQIVALGSEMLGTADRQRTLPAGETGFRVPPWSDPAVYRQLHQYRWRPEYAVTGHYGGHYGFTRKGFLDAFIMPAIFASTFGD
jgi:pimeloyl-ACP methyl ester carboxylesterase